MSNRPLHVRILSWLAILPAAVLLAQPVFAQSVGNQSGGGAPLVAVPGPNNNDPANPPGLSPTPITPDVPVRLAPAPLAPVDLYPETCQFAPLGAFTAAGTVIFDTDALTYNGTPGGVVSGTSAVFAFASINVPAGTTVRGVGSRKLVLLSATTVSVDGTVHVNGSNATPTAPSCQARTPSPAGAGGGDGGLGTIANPGAGSNGSGIGGGFSPAPSLAGAGGAGFGGLGGAGGTNGSPGGAGGAAYGDLINTGFDAGSGGGGASTNTGDGCQGASGGGGGGGLLLSARTSMTISATGVVSANGGTGALSDAGASAGGSGGSVILRSPAISHAGAVRANGGTGGSGGCCGGGGGGAGGRVLTLGNVTGAGTFSVAGAAGGGGNAAGVAGAAGVASSRPYISSCFAYNACDAGTGTLGNFTAAGTVVFDTDALTYGGAAGGVALGGIAVYYFDSISVPAGTTVRATGSRPWMLVAADSVSISGAVDANGANATATAPSCSLPTPSPGGPGAGAGGLGNAGPGSGGPGSGPGGGTAGTGLSGGGGGGFGAIAGNGGANGGAGGIGGPAYGNLLLALEGGSGGAAGSTSFGGCHNASGGGGGGALKIVAGNAITIAAGGVVTANGGNGALSDAGASAGGSGGGVILQAPTVSNGGTVRANGGNGGSGGCCGGGGGGGGGRVVVAGTSAGAGSYTANGGAAGSGNAAGGVGAAGTVNFVANLGLSITKTDGAVSAIPGAPISYQIVVRNDGAAALTDVPVTDSFPALIPGATFTATATGGASGFTAAGNTAINDLVALPAGSTITYTVTGTISPSGTGDLANRVCAGPTIALDTNGLTPQAELSITLTDSPDPVVAGTNLTYVATLTNGGLSDATDAAISLPLPPGTSFVSVTPSAGGTCNAASPVLCTWVGATAPGGTRSMTVVALVAPSVLQGTLLNATATASSATADPVPGNNTANATTTVNANANLSITLTDSPDPVIAGTQLTYVATLTNAGPSDAQGANISLPLPVGTSFVSVTPSAGGSCNAASPVVCTWAGATAPAAIRSMTVVALVAPGVLQGTLLSATATAASTTTDPTPGDNTASTTTTVNANANLSITLTDSPDPVIAGTSLTYVATLTNGGPSDAQTAAIGLPMPAATTFVSATATAGGICTAPAVGGNGPINCSWAGATAPAATRGVTVIVGVPAATPNGTVLTATATASSTTTDPTPANNTATATTTVNANADLSVTLTDTPDPVIAGTQLTYVATLSNAGPSDAQGASISLPLPAGTSLVSATPSAGGACNAASPVVCTWAGATTTADTRTATIVVLVAANVADGTLLSATATASSTTTDPTPGNNTATATTAVIARADLSITLTDSPDPVIAGTQLTYVATLSNAGPSDAQGASISLPLPVGTSLVLATPSAGGACNASSPVVCTWAGATTTADTRTATIVVLVAANVADGTLLSATATAASTTTDPNPGNNTATTTTAVIARADLSITLTDSPDPVIAGTQLTYVATLSNAGPSDAQTATITLPLPAGTSFVSAAPSAGGACNAASPVICAWAGGTAPGTTRTVTIVVLVAPSVLEGTVLTATATASSTTIDPNPANNTATTTTAVIARADLQIGLTASVPQVLINVPVTFTATSLNAGPSDAQNVSITLTLTPDFRYSSHTATGATCTTPQIGTTGAIVCTWAGATAPGVTRTLTVVAFSNVEGNTAVNASTTSDTIDPVPDNNATGLAVAVGYPFTEIPTLNSWGLLLLGLLMASVGFVAVRRQG